jgi:hypothetical protein
MPAHFDLLAQMTLHITPNNMQRRRFFIHHIDALSSPGYTADFCALFRFKVSPARQLLCLQLPSPGVGRAHSATTDFRPSLCSLLAAFLTYVRLLPMHKPPLIFLFKFFYFIIQVLQTRDFLCIAPPSRDACAASFYSRFSVPTTYVMSIDPQAPHAAFFFNVLSFRELRQVPPACPPAAAFLIQVLAVRHTFTYRRPPPSRSPTLFFPYTPDLRTTFQAISRSTAAPPIFIQDCVYLRRAPS